MYDFILLLIRRTKTKRWKAVCCAALLFAGVIAATLFVFMQTGCRSETNENNTDSLEAPQSERVSRAVEWSSTIPFDPPEFTYLAEIIDFAEIPGSDVWSPHNFILVNETVYFTAIIYYKHTLNSDYGEFEINRYYTGIFYLDLNTMEITQLPNFTATAPPESAMAAEEAMSSHNTIVAMHIDEDENIWVVEVVNIDTYDFPEGVDPAEVHENDRLYFWINYFQYLDQYTVIRKLDNTGFDLIEPIFISEIVDFGEDNHLFTMPSFSVDAQGNIYYGLNGISNGNSFQIIHILDSEGAVVNSLENRATMLRNSLMLLTNGNVAYYDQGSGQNSSLREIDSETGSWGRTIELPFTSLQVPLQGNDGFIYYTHNSRLFSVLPDTDEITEVLNWTASGINHETAVVVDVLADGRIMLITSGFNEDTYGLEIHIVYLTEFSFDDLQERTVLTIATVRLDKEIQAAITEFNRASSTHFIHVADYSVYETAGADGFMAALDRLALDIVTGKIPDMIHVSAHIPFQRYASMGLFEDLYPFIDNDPELSRGSFTDGVLEAAETRGSLYRLFPRFAVLTMLGNPNVLGDNPGWDLVEFSEIIDANPRVDVPLGGWATRESFLSEILYTYVEHFVDWETGTADFNNDMFIDLLESIASLPLEMDENFTHNDSPELIATGRQILSAVLFSSIEQYLEYQMLFGGDIVFKGYPEENGIGNILWPSNSIAMTVTCADKEGAWDFIRSVVTPNWQRRQFDSFFPVNKVEFDGILEKAMLDPEHPGLTGGLSGARAEITALTQNEVDQIRDLTANTVGIGGHNRDLWNIISEEASNYFRGQRTAQDTARIIQNRASTFMSEQFG